MLNTEVDKFQFRIRTRGGLVVERIRIHAGHAEEAERKLRQIYRQCEILARTDPPAPKRAERDDLDGLTFERLATALAHA